MQIFAIVVSLAIAVVGIALFLRAIRGIVGVIRIGGPAGRTDHPGSRLATMLKETLGHTRMLQWTLVGAAHWFVFIGFGLLFFTLVTAFGQLFDAHFAIPWLGTFFLFEWVAEVFTWVMLVAIIGFIAYRATRPRERTRGVKGRFFGSTMWQGYFVEFVILGVGLCIVLLRGAEYAIAQYGDDPHHASLFHFPTTAWLGSLLDGQSEGWLANFIYLVAMVKILISFTWMITISLNMTMGVAWHRFTVFFNIFFKRDASGRTALGAVKPLTSDGKAISLDDIDDLDEDATLGVGAIEDFSWKGILDFTTCTECGRCQSQCPAWNTDKPLSPKLLITALRDHAYAKAPYLQAAQKTAEGDRAALLEGNDTLTREVERPLVGDTGDDWFYMPENGSAVIDPDVLWSCTSCGACVQQCPVDIEHVDHIVDMRRYQILVESNFPAELNGLFKGLENKGNPWNMSPNARMDWAKGLDFEVKVVGAPSDQGGIESLDEVDWLFWIGCAGAYEDRAKKTTRAVAELLDLAGVSFGVLGNGETCTGDPARRAGNEFVFQGLAQQNVETFKEYRVKRVVSTCAHCFNTLKNEYKEFGVELEVVHHTQLLNRLVREGRLTPVQDGDGAHKRSITYHDPCYIGRHNGVYTPPRELLQVLPGAELVEMERNSERSFCCGAGGARMWMEENLGERINVNRTVEAVGTGADQIAVGCPFCRVMLSDGLTAQQAKGEAREEVEVLDVAQMLLASVRGEVATKVKPGAAPVPAAKAAPSEETRAEPEKGDATQTEETVTDTEDTEDAAPAGKAGPSAGSGGSGGSSLFDTPEAREPAETADRDTSPQEEVKPRPAAEPAPSGGSLFDLGGDDTSPQPQAEPRPADEPAPSGGSLFDLGGDDTSPQPQAEPRPADEPAPVVEQRAPASDVEAPEDESRPEPEAAKVASAGVPESGSLFDLEAPEPAPTASAPKADKAEPKPERPNAVATAAPKPSAEIPESGSLFDLEAPEPAPAAAAPKADEPEPQPDPEPAATNEAAPSSDEDLSSGEAISAAATAAANSAADDDEKEEVAPAAEQPEPAEQSADEPDEPEEKPKPQPSGEVHQPKTDVDINESGSLFDL
jgi:Fe-S oxidoreductase